MGCAEGVAEGGLDGHFEGGGLEGWGGRVMRRIGEALRCRECGW